MRAAFIAARLWASKHYVIVCTPLMLAVTVVATIDEVHTRFLAAFADGGDTLPLKIPLLLIGEVSALAAVVLTGYGRTIQWRAWTVVMFIAAAYTLWIPGTVLFVLTWPLLRSLGLVHAG